VSSDIAGHAAGELQDRMAGRPVVFIASGACGDVNPGSSGPCGETLRHTAGELAGELEAALLKAKPLGDDPLEAREGAVDLPVRILKAEEIARENEADVQTLTPQVLYLKDWNPQIRTNILNAFEAWRRTALLKLSKPTADRVGVNLQLLRMGGLVFAGVGAEVPSGFEDSLRKACPFPIYVLGYTGGDAGYIMPPGTKSNAYEIKYAHKFHGVWNFAENAYELLLGQTKLQALHIIQAPKN